MPHRCAARTLRTKEALGRNQEIEIRILGDFWRKPTFVHQRSPHRTRTRQGETTNLFTDIILNRRRNTRLPLDFHDADGTLCLDEKIDLKSVAL